MRMIVVAIASLCAGIASPAWCETLDNAAVIAMVNAGLGDEVVVAKVQSSANRFDLSTDNMIDLKQRGVSSIVLAAMISAQGSAVSAKATLSADSADPNVPHPSGLYLLASWAVSPKMVRIDPTTANQTKTGGILGYALTGGIASLSMKSVIPGGQARVVSTLASPKFYFFFDQANQSLSSTYTGVFGATASATSPNEFSLVRFDAKKDRREARVGSFNIAGAKTGVMDKDRIAFSYDQVSPGVFVVTPAAPLPPGQYGFLYSITAGGGASGFGGGGTMTARVFDFAVDGVN